MCDNSIQVRNRYRMKGKPRTHSVGSQRRKKRPVVGLSGDVSEKPGARHLPPVHPGNWYSDRFKSQGSEFVGSFLYGPKKLPEEVSGESGCPLWAKSAKRAKWKGTEVAQGPWRPSAQRILLVLQKKPVPPISAPRHGTSLEAGAAVCWGETWMSHLGEVQAFCCDCSSGRGKVAEPRNQIHKAAYCWQSWRFLFDQEKHDLICLTLTLKNKIKTSGVEEMA